MRRASSGPIPAMVWKRCSGSEAPRRRSKLNPTAAAQDLLDRRGERHADAGKRQQPAAPLRFGDRAHVAPEPLQRLAGAAVGADAKRRGALLGKQRCRLLEELRNLRVGDGQLGGGTAGRR